MFLVCLVSCWISDVTTGLCRFKVLFPSINNSHNDWQSDTNYTTFQFIRNSDIITIIGCKNWIVSPTAEVGSSTNQPQNRRCAPGCEISAV